MNLDIVKEILDFLSFTAHFFGRGIFYRTAFYYASVIVIVVTFRVLPNLAVPRNAITG